MINWLESISDFSGGSHKLYYPLESAQQKFEVREICPDGYLVLCRTLGNEHWLNFAVMQFGYEQEDKIYLVPVFHGCGSADILRECRHTYWGDDGYIFYPDAEIITAGLKALEEFFDMN